MGSSKYVGRVGALAVFLGIGLVVGGPAAATAAADDTGGATSSPAADRSDAPEERTPARKADKTDRADQDPGTGASDAEPAPDGAEQDDDQAATEQPKKQRRSDQKPTATDRDGDGDPGESAPTSDPTPQAELESDDEPDAAVLPAANAAPSTGEQPVTAADPVKTTAPQPLPSAATSLLEVPAPPAAPDPAGAPILAPAMWMVAAAGSRRDPAAPNTAPNAGLAYQTSPSMLTGKVRGDVWAQDPDRDRLTYAASTATGGTVVVNRWGNFTYTPTAATRHAAAVPGGSKTDTFTITVSDGAGGTAVVPITVAVRPANAKPSARSTVGSPDNVSGVVQGRVTVTDRDGDAVTYTALPSTDRGRVVLNTDGTFTYTPTAEAREDARSIFRRLDRFTVTVNDGHGGTDTTTVYVRITPPPANSAPTNGDASVNDPDSDGVVTGTVTANDPNGDILSYALGSTAPARGTVSVSATGSFTYTPTAAARHAASAADAGADLRSDGFTVVVSDGKGGTLTVPVTVAVRPANVEPVGGNASFGDPDSTSGAVTGTVTARDADDDTLTYSGSATTVNGKVVITQTGGFTYTPTLSARQQASQTTLTDTFTVTVADGHGGTDTFDVTVPVSPLPASGEQPATGVVSVPNPSGGPLEYEVDNDTSVGTATVDPAGTWTYTPTPEARHQAAADNADTADKQHTFTVTVTDSEGNTTVVPITVSIVGANEVPVATEQPEQQIDPDSGVTSGVLIVADADGDPLDADIEVDPAQGTVDYDIATGVWTFEATPEARHAAAAALAGAGGSARMMRGFAASAAQDPTVASVTFTFRDGYGGVQTTVVDVQISPANEEPSITPVSGGAPEAGTGTVSGTIGFTDPDGDAPVFGVGTSIKGVEVSFDEATGRWTYTPTAALRAAASVATATTADRLDTFTIAVDDGHGGSAQIDITVPILFSTTADGDIALTGKTASPIVTSADGRHVYVATENIFTEDGTTEYGLTVVDTVTRSGYIVPLQGEPDGPVVISRDGAHAYATVGNTVLVIDTGTATTRSVTLPGPPAEFIVASPDSAHAYAPSRTGDNLVVTAIDAATAAAVDIPLPGRNVVDVTFSDDGDRVYVTTSDIDSFTLTIIDSATLTTRTIALPDHLSDTVHVTGDGTRAFTMTAAADGEPLAFVEIDLVTGDFEPGVTWADGQNLTPVTYSADSRYAYLVVRAPGAEPGTFEDFFVGIDTSIMEGGGGTFDGTPRGAIQLSADGRRAYLLTDDQIAFAAPFDSTGASPQFRGVVTGQMVVSADDRFAYVPTYEADFDEHYLLVVDLDEGTSRSIFVPGQFDRPALSADGTRVFGTISTRDENGAYEHSFVVVDLATETVQSIMLPGAVFDRVDLTPDQKSFYALTANAVTDTQFAYLLSIEAVPEPPIVLPTVVGVPQSSAVVGATGRGYQFVYDENAGTTTVVVAEPDGHVTVAGTIAGNAVQDGTEPEIVRLSNGGVAFIAYEDVGSPDGPVVRLVTVSQDGTMTSDITGGEGRWVHSATGTHYYLAVLPVENEPVAVWRVTIDGDVAVHSRGYAATFDQGSAVTGADGTLYLAAGQIGADGRERASLWRISPTGEESIVALTSLEGTAVTDSSYAQSVAVAADGTAYLVALTLGYEDNGTLNQAIGVLVVAADGSIHRVHLPNIPAGAMKIVAAGDHGVFGWYDRTNSWVAVIAPSGGRVDHPVSGIAGDFVAAADGSGAYAPVDADTLLYVDSAGVVSTVEVGAFRGEIVTGPGATVYAFDAAGGRLIAVTDGVASSSSLGAPFRTGALHFASDGTPFALLENFDEYRVAVPTAGVYTETFYGSDYPGVQFEVIDDTAYAVIPTYDGVQLLAIDSSGSTVFTKTFGSEDTQPAGPVALGADGTFYYTVYEESPGDTPRTRVFATNTTGTAEVFSSPGAPPSVWGESTVPAVVAASDGTLYVSITDVQTDPEAVVTTVHVVPAPLLVV